MFLHLVRRKPALQSAKFKCLVVYSAILLQVYLYDNEDISLNWLHFFEVFDYSYSLLPI